ncbi:ATP-grasp domain-containing protein [Hyphomicrobium sp.]|uniref:ATP-grasp domain-containing protein n=1 Tax=Hyphomicrobium sp. TaxID=82 RepID=UPI001D57D89C|nr:ATP-grasp domain-containing protein [Hyphomicrobium sp.]MBY0560522.1 ATP-grasp domain-containing protein [Hyphomicrobium sp.]
MSGETVLIAAFSGRSLAQSARRAGYRPLVADAFGDLDTQHAAEDFRVLDGVMQTGFRTKPIIAALTDLSQSARSTPIGLVLGSGFEDKPRLVAALASRFKLLGSDAATYKVCKDPQSFFGVLDKLGIAHPETRTSPPADPTGWISKRVGGSGGRHIRTCVGLQRAKPRRYFQKLLDGDRISVSGVFLSAPNSVLALTRQWTSPSPEQPYRFGGAVSLPPIDPDVRRRIVDAATDVSSALQLKGMASLDFVVKNGTPYLLEVNPRPGASLDVLDDEAGFLFRAHIAMGLGEGIMPRFPDIKVNRSAIAMAILHADRGPILLNDIPWPDWSADRGPPGTFIPAGAPLATVFAEAPTADAAEALARARLAELEDLIYEHAKS